MSGSLTQLIAVLVLVGLCLFLFFLLKRRDWPTDVHFPDIECDACGAEVPESSRHRIESGEVGTIGGIMTTEPGAVTTISADLCPKHCPGDCNKPEDHTDGP